MEEILLIAFLKFAVPLIIELARKWGFFNFAEELAAKTMTDLVVAVKETKTYQEYPDPNKRNNPFNS